MILIVGGMGFVGLNLARALVPLGPVTLTTHRRRRAAAELHGLVGRPVDVVSMDLADPVSVAKVVADTRPEVVVQLAAPPIGALPVAEEVALNVVGLVHLLEAARAAQVRRVVVASSIDVYAGVDTGPYTEGQPLPLASCTATSAMKKAEEVLSEHFADRTGLDVVLLRLAHIYGPLYHSMYALTGQLVHAAVNGRAVDAGPGRWDAATLSHGLDLCYVRDCTAAIAAVVAAERLGHRVYNVGGGVCVGVPALLDAVRASAPGVAVPDVIDGIGFDPGAARVMHIGRIRTELGWAPRYPVAAGVADYAGWLRVHAY